MDKTQIIEAIKNPEKYKFFYLQKVRNENDEISMRKDRARYFITSDGRIAMKAKGRQRYGYPVEDLSLIIIEEKKNIKSPEDKWGHSWAKVAQRLQRSGLYPDLLANIKLALEIGYDTMQKAYEMYWKDYEGTYENRSQNQIKEIKKIDERLITKNDKDKEYVNTEILWHLKYPAKVIKMNFGRFVNEEKLAQIKEALEKKEKISICGRTNYDVSFSYNPEIKKAWYSLEYKDCGNGHYYLVLDETHALFYEDD